jgi:hypothetical protein
MFWCFFESESRVSHPRSCSLDSRESAGSSARRTAGIRHTAPAVREQVKAACRQQAAQAPRAIVAAVCSQLGASSCDCVAPGTKTHWHTSAAAVALAVLLVVACEALRRRYIPRRLAPREQAMAEADSALQENQQKKGEYSYYYAHTSGSGDQISTPTSEHVPIARTKIAKESTADDVPAPKKMDSYQWCDNGEKGVQVFVNLPGIGQHPAESILLNHTADSMTLDLKDFSGVAHQQLHLLLKKKVKGAKLKQKSDKLLITLAKARPKTNWYSLTRKDTESVDAEYSSSSSSDEEADEPAEGAGVEAAAEEATGADEAAKEDNDDERATSSDVVE